MTVKRKKNSTQSVVKYGDKMDFLASEAYKLIRANLRFSLATQESGTKAFGVTSSETGEGKTTTSINLAYSFALTGQKVLLIEGDMRLPNIAKHLKIQKNPGLSELISGMCTISEALVPSGMIDNLHVIPAGSIPPNPSELLGCARMKELIDKMSQRYDVIILDLPPVNEVSDAITVSGFLKGMVLVVREGMTRKRFTDEAFRQLKLAGVNLLGIIVTFSKVPGKKYKSYYKN